jgi:serine/threonine-protein kinase ATR
MLLSVLDPFVNDPIIDWRRYRGQQQGSRQEQEARRSIRVVNERLQGMYNLPNPNLRAIRRTDLLQTPQDNYDEVANLLPLSVEGQAHRLIAEATSNENLVQMYVGWTPWL